MSGALPSPVTTHSWFGQAWGVASDLLLATALIWAVPLSLGALAALVRLVLEAGS